MKRSLSQKAAYVALLTALSLIAFLIESLMPPLFIPGAKLGLGNVFLTLCLIWFSLPEALIMLAAKCISAAVFGGAIQVLYSLPAGLCSLLLTCILIRFFKEKLSIVAVSALAAVVHNLVQLGVFAFFAGAAAFCYAPYLTAAGAVSGVLSGTATFFIMKYYKFGADNTASDG